MLFRSFQPYELLMIFGGALGAFVIANDRKAISLTWQSIPVMFHGSRYTRELYMSLMALMFDVLTKVRREGLMSLEDDIDAPYESAIFGKYRLVLADHHLLDFITDYLRLMVSGNLNPHEIEAVMDAEIETHHHEAHAPVAAIQRVAGGLPEMDAEPGDGSLALAAWPDGSLTGSTGRRSVGR
mgnify:CR=1 FL=1